MPQGDFTEKPRSDAVAPGALSRLLEELVAVPDGPMETCSLALQRGDLVGRFEILSELGRGGFGAVYAARDPELRRDVALKTLRPGVARRTLSSDTIRREAEAVARLEHPAIVTIFDVGSFPGGAFLVMELLRGETLARRISHGPLCATEALAIAEQVAAALAHAHSRGVLHRDLKPANVFITEDGRVKLLDFGLAHLLGRADESHGSGTPAYMAPEQARGGPCDARTDVYAAGLLLAEMTGASRPSAVGVGPASLDAPPSVPPGIVSLARAAITAEPSQRPRDGGALLEAMRDVRRAIVRRARIRRAVLVSVAAMALGLLVATVATWRVWRTHLPSGPTTVVVADVRNDTGDPELEGFAELIATSLRPSHRVRVLTRDIVAKHLRDLRGTSGERVDEALARDLGRRADAGVVLLGTLRKSGEAFALEVRGLDPHRDEYAFTVMERGRGKESVLEIVDRTALSLRRALEESDSAVRDADERIGDVVTRSLAAYQAYSEGNRCRERKTVGCWQHFERAVAIDPTFAMAHYELAVATLFGPDFTDRGLPALRDALRHVNRAPEAERIKIRAFAAWAEGRDATSDALYSEALLRHPDDYFVARGAGSFLMTRDEPDRALGALRRAVELAPTPGMAMEELADALSALGRHDELAELEARAEAVAAGGGSAEAVRALVVARAARGDTAGAIDAARLAVSQAASEDARDEARADLWMMQLQAGDLSVESDIRRRCDHEATYQLSTLLGLAGRRAEALRVLEFGERPECPPRSADEWQLLRNGLFFHASVARFSAGFTDVERARRHARWAQERNSTLAPHLAVYLAYLGDSATAADLARGLPPESPRRRAYEAVVLWRRGDRGGARAILDELTARTPWSSTPHGLPPSFLRGELAAEMGDDAAAIASLERFGSLHFYRLDFWSWAHPRSLYLLARSYERTGDMHRARERIAKLLALWRSADPDLPLLAEARALGRRLAVSADGTVDGN